MTFYDASTEIDKKLKSDVCTVIFYGRIDRLEVRNIYLDVCNNCCARIAVFNLLIKKANNYLVQWKVFKPLLQFRGT